tara:strand:- start:182 stop:301 length:120 start_codon:yes stop_codon:yes gene_type:complete
LLVEEAVEVNLLPLNPVVVLGLQVEEYLGDHTLVEEMVH